jgi:hypothetical protein
MHLLLYAGRSSALLVRGDTASGYVNYVPLGNPFTQEPETVTKALSFQGSGALSTSGITSAAVGKLSVVDPYAFWRTVSVGLRLSLLNPAETNDGWFEAVRVREPFDSQDYLVMGKHYNDTAGSPDDMTLAPTGVLQNFVNDELVNQKSYITGLLRDIGNHTFKLNPIKDEHDVVHCSKSIYTSTWGAEYRNSATPGATEGDFFRPLDGWDDWKEFCSQEIDSSFDMIYIRIHGRPTATGTLPPSVLHTNVISNQEIVFDNDQRESRFHTASHKHSLMEQHTAAARAHVVPIA